MRNEKFIYNVNTLSYEKLEYTWKSRIILASIFSIAVFVCSLVISYVWDAYTVTPEEKRLKRELATTNAQYEKLNNDLVAYNQKLNYLKEKDNNLYRMTLGVEPVDSYTWESGIGGSNNYEQFNTLTNSDIVVNTSQKIDKLGRQLNLQYKSLEDLTELAKEKEEELKAVPSIRPLKQSSDIKLLSGYGMRKHPIHKIKKMHFGIDFTAKVGTPIHSTGDGVVVKTRKSKSGYGNHVVIDHGFGYKTLYAHMHDVEVKKGQVITKGEIIGTVGNTGTSTAPHLHYEVIQKGKKVDPIHFCVDGLSPEEYKEMTELAADENQYFDFGGEEF